MAFQTRSFLRNVKNWFHISKDLRIGNSRAPKPERWARPTPLLHQNVTRQDRQRVYAILSPLSDPASHVSALLQSVGEQGTAITSRIQIVRATNLIHDYSKPRSGNLKLSRANLAPDTMLTIIRLKKSCRRTGARCSTRTATDQPLSSYVHCDDGAAHKTGLI